MATPVQVTMETPITIKVLIEGSNRRFKLPLKELGVSTFENKVRAFLQVPANQELKLERYSDSLASYVQLDANNPQVYKTLFRAAKAKLKLRVKATIISNEEETAPVTQQPQATTSTTTLVNVEQATPSEVKAPTPQTTEPEKSVVAEDEAPIPRPFEVSSRPWGKVNPLHSKLAFRAKNAAISSPPTCSWSVYCNKCDKPMANEHYHCQVCDEGDYDLCASCVDAGHHCYEEEHWLVKRFVQHGRVINSTSETLQAKPKVNVEPVVQPTQAPKDILCEPFTEKLPEVQEPELPTRTCNCCVRVHPDTEFVTCKDCDDYDLCIPCHVGGKHGHHPGHSFEAATSDASIGPLAEFLCTPGRNVRHAAVCDGCDKYIYGVRHKCLNCPNWDFCGKCFKNAKFIHPGHRFAPIYEPLPEIRTAPTRHFGIFCDGPLCKDKDAPVYMTGVRYKCAVCDDTDFCESCETSPSNRHNRTHPLIKFKTPVRKVSVTTMGEDKHGAAMRTMGDQSRKRSTSTETTPVQSANAATQVQTMADLKPSEETTPVRDLLSEPIQEKIKDEDLLSTPVPQTEVKTEMSSTPTEFSSNELIAHFVRDTVADGTKVLPGALFTQVWTLRNPGPQVWPTGCSVRYVGGDNMLNVDDSHPSSSSEINEATESNVVGRPVEIGEEISFRVLMKAPKREGTAISYWRLKDAEGTPFGHRLWCHIDVSMRVAGSTATPNVPASSGFGRPQSFGMRVIDEDEMQRLLAEQQDRKTAILNAQKSRGVQAEAVLASSSSNKTLDAALKRHAELRAQVIENMRRAADRMNAELERMETPRKEPTPPVELASQPEVPKASCESVHESETEPEARSTMIFPTLEKESPVSSTHEAVTAPQSNAPTEAADNETLLSPSIKSDLEFFEDAETVDYSDDSDQGFATDEEYDILDASDQELA